MKPARQDAPLLLPGFDDPVHDSQRIFRQILRAMSRPALPVTLDVLPTPPSLLHRASGALCLALFDHDTPVWLDGPIAKQGGRHIAFHTGAPLVSEPEDCAFALIADGNALPDLARFPRGHAEYPERGVTLIIQVERFDGPEQHILSGPGIENTATLSVRGLAGKFWPAFAANRDRFPLGFDTILVHDATIVALPRSTVMATMQVRA